MKMVENREDLGSSFRFRSIGFDDNLTKAGGQKASVVTELE